MPVLPPALKLNIYRRLDRTKATESEARGEDLFFGKAVVTHRRSTRMEQCMI